MMDVWLHCWVQAEVRRQEEEQRLKEEKEAEQRQLEEKQQQEEAEAMKEVSYVSFIIASYPCPVDMRIT